MRLMRKQNQMSEKAYIFMIRGVPKGHGCLQKL